MGSTATMAELRVNHRFSSVNAHEIIRINQIFASKNALQKKISLYALRRNFEFKVKKSDRVRYEVVCANNNCMWRMRATKLHGDNTEAFMIRAFKDEHICSLNIMKRDHRQATSSVIGDIIQPMFDGISRQYKPRDIVHEIRSNYGVNIIYNKAWAVKEVALSGLWGTPEDSYAKLPLWSHVLKSKNPGTFTRIEIDDQNRFLYFFMALGASIRGFQHMRRVTAVDGTTLKNRYRGLLYIASCLDANNQIYPLAYGIGPGETDAAYTWFFESFKEAFGDDPNIAFISDRHKSIAKAICTVFPNNHHGHCTYHLGTNLRAKKFKGNVNAIISTFNDAARAYIVEDFDKAMQLLAGVSIEAVQYLKDASPSKWARSHFPGNRYNIMTTNIAESMNSVLIDARDKPVLPLLDHIRDVLQRWWYERRTNTAAMQTPVTNWLEKIMQDRSNNGRGLCVMPMNLYEFQVVGHGMFVGVVNLENKTCSCKEFDIDGFPCVHAIAACKHQHISPYFLCSVHYSVDSLRDAYSETIYPLKSQWHAPDDVINQVVLPPQIGKQSGRPRKKRIQSQGEERHQYRCGRCKQVGHSS
ncbi:uncharacterized protein LOC125419637 [Ziziphus jujuba]|uniref:Uncharacterized protein LOC125419637 n=1 Tax=Ziziphus jujuba TaxID=326968 RepID=A0ABM3ZVK9_ZIZJJ|nr:uncharacterized protein LOC125419637 [Ziziphus jujuba]XP_060668521.1 uncharacterized protein LOC125419637 [Ziziphus jujuba]XP_060668522.1 uncharacterized protein LOC125419637 [Ziziphus jujuba]XP_060668523.1 uncharacterized protein LOC125419637 [Ziziphus jujuba]XP_060668524.1 uncharacterized protein LOC125419637 [Ziziphus jujuba]XP_060668525.1 uncharacterized protein LOC125419637 [Ziziphus jujuba]XP_060668526.1 uncharacterized protein LOC125419637 [Ziziphus jujuba]XP_060668527.1 uncharacte